MPPTGGGSFRIFHSPYAHPAVKNPLDFSLRLYFPGNADNYIRMFEKRNTEPPREFVNFCAEQLGTTSAYLYGESDTPEKEKAPAADSSRGVTDEDLKFALFGGGDVTDAQFEEVKNFARFIKERDANGQSK